MSQEIPTTRLLCTSAVGFLYTNSHGRKVLCICKFALSLIQHKAMSKADWKCTCMQFNLGRICVDMIGQLHDLPALHMVKEPRVTIG
jgi:hypothetical protein